MRPDGTLNDETREATFIVKTARLAKDLAGGLGSEMEGGIGKIVLLSNSRTARHRYISTACGSVRVGEIREKHIAIGDTRNDSSAESVYGKPFKYQDARTYR